jgi:serine/threonine protein phosphatase PrpC
MRTASATTTPRISTLSAMVWVAELPERWPAAPQYGSSLNPLKRSLWQPMERQTCPLESRLLQSIREANRVVRETAQSNPQFQNMGTTLVCACLDGARILIGNVGDSRAYLVRNGACLQITQDHSLLDEQLRSGMITQEMAATSNLQSVITRAIGAAETVQPDFFAAELQPDDMLLLATDGLTRYLQPAEIASIALASVELPAICQSLVEQAKDRGGADNITCIVLRAFETTPAAR